MILIGVTLAVLAVLVIAGCFLVRRWKKQEIENRRKKALKAARNTTMSMDDLIEAMDAQPKLKSEPEKTRPAGKTGKAMSEAEAEKWAEAMNAALLSLSEALKEAGALREDWGSVLNDNESARCTLLPAGGEPALTESLASFSTAVDQFLARQARVFQSQQALIAFPGTMAAPLDKLAAARKEVERLLKPLARLPEKQLPESALTLRLVATLFLTRKTNSLANAGKLASSINGQLSRRKSEFYKQTFGPASPKQDELERQLLACLETVFAAGQNLKQAEESFRTLDRKRERANGSIQRLKTNRLETTPEAVDDWLAELQEAYVEFFTSSVELKFTRVPDLESSIKTWREALGELNALLGRLGKIKQPTAHFHALHQVALSWYTAWNKYRIEFTTPVCKKRPGELSQAVASLVAAFVNQARIVSSIRAELFTLSEQASESAKTLEERQGAESLPAIGDIPDLQTLKSYVHDLGEKVSSSLLAQTAVQHAAERFRKQVIAFENAIKDAGALCEKLRAHQLERRDAADSALEAFSVQDEASIESCADLAARMVEMLKTWKSNAEEYRAVAQAVERPSQQSAKVASLVESIEEKLLELYGRKANLDRLLGEVQKSWDSVEASRRVCEERPYRLEEDGTRSPLSLPEKPTDNEVNHYLGEVRQWALTLRELEQAAGQDRQSFGEELGLQLQDVSDFQSLMLEVASLERPLHIADEAVIEVVQRFSAEHVSGIAEAYLHEESDWRHRPLPLSVALAVLEDVDGYCTGDEAVACFRGDSDKVEVIRLEALRKSTRSLVFALVQSEQAQSKFQAAKNRSADCTGLGKPPAIVDISEESCDFNALVDDMVAYKEKLSAIDQLQDSLNEARAKAASAFNERDLTVVNRQTALVDVLQKLKGACFYGASETALLWTDEMSAAKGILKAGIWRRRNLGY